MILNAKIIRFPYLRKSGSLKKIRSTRNPVRVQIKIIAGIIAMERYMSFLRATFFWFPLKVKKQITNRFVRIKIMKRMHKKLSPRYIYCPKKLTNV